MFCLPRCRTFSATIFWSMLYTPFPFSSPSVTSIMPRLFHSVSRNTPRLSSFLLFFHYFSPLIESLCLWAHWFFLLVGQVRCSSFLLNFFSLVIVFFISTNSIWLFFLFIYHISHLVNELFIKFYLIFYLYFLIVPLISL